MRMSQLFVRTLRDDPADAETDSHRLLVRAGFIRRVASGIYAWLPLGQRVLARVAAIVREEMNATGAQELTLPIVQPLELWARSGRDEAYGPLMFRLEDRKETPFCLSPTAEEVITSLVAGEYSSYRDLPVSLYQINWKYRDELRPRFGLLRAREFLMKDAYSFHTDDDDLKRAYQEMYDAYSRVFERCALTFRAVEGEAGEMGGDVNHEFMAVAAVGEDDFAARPELARGYIGPHHPSITLVVADPSVAAPHGWVTGANEVDHHVRDAVLGRDFNVDVWADLVAVAAGDPCPRCGSPLAVDRGIEVGQVFQLGTKYAEALDARYTDEAGEQHPMVMGCYGIGVSRIVAAVVEEHHDDKGIAWPPSAAPFAVHLVALPGKGDTAGDVIAAADRLYRELRDAGIDGLDHERDERPRVKFADAAVIRVPVPLTMGAKGVARGVVERRNRATGEEDELPLDGAPAVLAAQSP